MLQQEETLARSKARSKSEVEDPRAKKEIKRTEDENKALKAEIVAQIEQHLDGGNDDMVVLQAEIKEVME